MAIGRARGERRVEKAIVNALESPLLYGSDISNAKKILFNIYTSEDRPLFVSEMREVDAFMYGLNPDIDVIWGTSDDNTLGEDAKVIILATGIDNRFMPQDVHDDNDEEYYNKIIAKLYREPLLSQAAAKKKALEAAEEKEKSADTTSDQAAETPHEKKPDEEKTNEKKTEEEHSPSLSFNISDIQATSPAPEEKTESKVEAPEVQPVAPDKRETPPAAQPSRPAPSSFLNRLKQHLKKGLTDLTSDIDD